MKKQILEFIGISVLFIIFTAQKSGYELEFDHSLFDKLLRNNVTNGMVNYRNIKDADFGILEQYLHKLENVDPADFEKWDRNSKLAFWINAYNAITIYGIVINYPLEYGGLLARLRFPKSSIRQINKVWDRVFTNVMGKGITLNQIEHDILRVEFDEPRIHFAIVCASVGCPRLMSEAYIPEKLDEQINKAAKDFVNRKKYIDYDSGNNILHLSSIFDWYKDDFKYSENSEWLDKYGKDERGIVEFVERYSKNEALRKQMKENKVKIKYLDYDWSLNELKKSNKD